VKTKPPLSSLRLVVRPPATSELCRIPFATQLSSTGFACLKQAASLVEFDKDTLVYDENRPCDRFLFVLDGEIRVFKKLPENTELTLYRIVREELCALSLNLLMSQGLYSATAVAVKKTKTICVSSDVFNLLYRSENRLREYCVEFLSKGDRKLKSSPKSDERLIEFLLVQQEPVITLSHEEIASQLGIAKEIVSKTLLRFRRNGWIEVHSKAITIVAPERLRDVIHS
jgi:CRP/FNR family transcriptional regulator